MNRVAFCIATLAIGGLVGCNSSPPGGSAAGAGGSRSETFNLKAPALATTLKQGETKEVTITVSRGKDFKEDVKLTVDAPAGLKVDPADAVVKASDKADVTLHVTAAKDAAVGDHTVRVTGKPESGVATPVDFKVTVKESK